MNTSLFTLVDGGGTVPPEVGTVRRLVERAHRVVVLAEDSMAADVVASGAELRRWTTAPNRASRSPEDDPYRDWECKNPIQLFNRLLEAQFTGPAAAYAADNAARVTSRGAGLKLKNTASPTAVATAVGRLLAEPGFRQSAEALGESIRRDAASGTLVAELEDLPAATDVGRASLSTT